MEFPISIQEAQTFDLDQIYLIIEKNADSCRNISKEMIEKRIRNHAGTFLLASLEEQVTFNHMNTHSSVSCLI